MRFDLVDRVLELTPDRIVTLKAVSGAEEYLSDHFPTFPVLPGVLMLEAMVQAARRLVDSHDPAGPRVVLSRVRALKYGRFVKPGEILRVEVRKHAFDAAGGVWDFKGQVMVGEEPAASGRFDLRGLKLFVASEA